MTPVPTFDLLSEHFYPLHDFDGTLSCEWKAIGVTGVGFIKGQRGESLGGLCALSTSKVHRAIFSPVTVIAHKDRQVIMEICQYTI